MLPPDYLDGMPDAVVEAVDKLMDSVLAVTAKRVSKYGWTEQSQWETDRLEAMGVLRADVQKTIKKYAPDVAEEIKAAFQDATAETVQQDQPYYEAAGLWDDTAIDRAAMRKILNSGLNQTARTFSNLTGTLANETAKQFSAAMDQAWLAASTGVITPQEAGYRAIQQLCKDGIKVVTYPSGHQDTIEVATRRALLTGINQAALNAQDQLLLDLGGDLVEVTAHAGARPSHAEWQGKVFSRWGKTPGYVTLEAGTGFGTGAGLGGWNCRHSYHPFFEGYTPAYTQEQLEAYNAKKYTYNGKELTEYEASQIQRYYERGIRRWKREYLAAEAMDEDTTEAAVRLKSWREKEAAFRKETGFRLDSSRSQVGGFGHSQASKATWASKEYYQVWSKSIGVNDAIKTLANYYDVKYNDPPRYALLEGYVQAVHKKDISPLVGFARYEAVSQEIQRQIVGTTTATGVTIESFATHFVDRVIGQTSTSHKGMRCGVSIDDVLDTLQNPVSIGPIRTLDDGDTRQTLHGKNASVSYSVRDKRLIQTNP